MPRLAPLPEFDDTRVVAELGAVAANPDPEDKDLETATRLRDGAITARREFDTQFNTVVRSPALSEVGKVERVRELGEKILDAIARGEHAVEALEATHAKLADEIRFKPAPLSLTPGTDAVGSRLAALAVREREVREWLRTKDDAERLTIFNEAVDTRDELVFGAFVHAPARMRNELLFPDTIQKGIERWETNGNPKKAARVATLGRAIQQARDARRMVVEHVRQQAKLPEAYKPVTV